MYFILIQRTNNIQRRAISESDIKHRNVMFHTSEGQLVTSVLCKLLLVVDLWMLFFYYVWEYYANSFTFKSGRRDITPYRAQNSLRNDSEELIIIT